ncbi:MAG TPA: hypothetical protein VGD98_08050 [Ktedonobacteraceae bacterium]
MHWMKDQRLFLLLFLLMVLASCSSTAHLASKPTSVVPAPSPSSVEAGVPTPSRTELAPIPTNCSLSALPGTKLFPKGWGGYLVDMTLVGKSPIWAQINPDLQEVLQPGTADNPWTGTKIIWEEAVQNFHQKVTVQVKNLATGDLAWWGQGNAPPVMSVLVLDTSPNANDHGSPVTGWNEWGSVLYLLTSGCYSMDVTWPGGAWHVVFAAGR